MAEYIFYWKEFRHESSLPSAQLDFHWHTDAGRIFKQIDSGDRLWVVVHLGAAGWRLERMIRVAHKRDETRVTPTRELGGRRFHIIGNPRASRSFSVNDQPDLEPTLRRLSFATGRRIEAHGAKIGQSLQGARRLSPTDADLMRKYRSFLDGKTDPDEWSKSEADAEERAVEHNLLLAKTTRKQLVEARTGQGKYRLNVLRMERACRVTKLAEPALLVASHIKPWRYADNRERLDGNNGLLLSPHIDKLFDKGCISFSDTGDLLCADDAARKALKAWGIPISASAGSFSERQRFYLQYHRASVFGKAFQATRRRNHGRNHG